MEKLIYDGEGAIFGRMATVVAKDLLKGNSVDLIHCEGIIVSGNKNIFAKKIQAKRNMGRGGSLKGPKYIRQPDRLVKRMIRGMLPRNIRKGEEAFKRLKCHIGNGNLDENVLKNSKKFKHNIPRKYSTIKEITGMLK